VTASSRQLTELFASRSFPGLSDLFTTAPGRQT
jgi:hypothetical protein